MFPILALISGLMWQDFDSLSVKFNSTASLDSLLSGLLILKLNVSKSSALAILEALDFAGSDSSKLGEGLRELGLGNLNIQILDKDIGLWVDEVLLLDGASDLRASNCSIVELLSASGSLCSSKELEETISVLSLSLFVSVDDRLVDRVAELLNVLVKI